MRQIHLKLYQRVTIWQTVGNYEAPRLRDAATFLRIIEKIRLTDEEMRECQFMAQGPQVRWTLPKNGYGDRSIDFEDEETEALVKALESVERVRVSDASWMLELIESLKPEAVRP